MVNKRRGVKTHSNRLHPRIIEAVDFGMDLENLLNIVKIKK